jgi:mono/diheme cytochrome c family protein
MRPVALRVLFLLVVGASALSERSVAVELPRGPNRSLVFAHCQTCHSLDYLTDSRGLDRPQWESVIDSMRRLGLPAMSAEEHDKLLDYLAAYLGPHPPAAAGPVEAMATTSPAAPAAPSVESAKPAAGEALFEEHCAICHQSTGEGIPGQFPPLAGNRDLFVSRDFPALVIIKGLQGMIEVGGESFNSAMPGFDFLSNDEVAALVAYIRSAWGNEKLRPADLAPIDAAAVKTARASDKSAYQARQR